MNNRQRQQRREDEMDRASRPLRQTFAKWIHERGRSGSISWNRDKQQWILESFDLTVRINEAEAVVTKIVLLNDVLECRTVGRATTPRGLRRVLERL